MGTAIDSADPAPKRPPDASPRWAVAVILVIALAVAAIFVAARPPDTSNDRERDPLELTDEGELRAVVGAVSAVIRATEPADEEAALRALEALRPASPGAADVRDSCATTYRGNHDAMALFHALPPTADGGAPPPEAAARLARIRTLITEANESLDRCVTLYQAAAHRLHIEPAHRPH